MANLGDLFSSVSKQMRLELLLPIVCTCSSTPVEIFSFTSLSWPRVLALILHVRLKNISKDDNRVRDAQLWNRIVCFSFQALWLFLNLYISWFGITLWNVWPLLIINMLTIVMVCCLSLCHCGVIKWGDEIASLATSCVQLIPANCSYQWTQS